MLAIIIISTLICLCSGIFSYLLISIRKTLVKNKIKITQNQNAIKFLHEQSKSHESKLDAILTLLNDVEAKSFLAKGKDNIEQQYDRAKRILKNNLIGESDLLNSCDITAEEIELLSGLIHNNESI